MNTNLLKKFAQDARRKLIDQISSKLEFVLSTDSAELREKSSQIRKLREEINATSKEQVVEKVAYTWFNRLMALRFMDANDYQPLGLRVVTPRVGYSIPEILDEAKKGHIDQELPVKSQHIYDLLDSKIPSNNPQNEAYKELLIGACNYLNKIFPFLFERISDYSELLLPEDLTSEFSIVHDVREGMTIEDCQEVEIIGWLYQFYISEKKDEVFASKSKVKKEDIPAATQLFTPRWIVEYMVQNTLGKLWLQNKPESKLREQMPYFIESESLNANEYLKVGSVEEITLLDQACGSGHILVYGFELLTKIYEEEGYNTGEIPQLIIEKNLYGFEIDERAAQLADLALMMKARSYHRRLFRKDIKPNILCLEDLKLDDNEIEQCFDHLGVRPSDELKYDLDNLKQATNLGSLMIPHSSQSEVINVLSKFKEIPSNSDAFLEHNLTCLKRGLLQLQFLAKKYDCVVDNPPYMGSGNMNGQLFDFVKTNYPDSKSDLMACFMETGLNALKPHGFLAMINQHSWMFISSYTRLRNKLIRSSFIDTLLHLGARTFPEIGGEVVQSAAFTLLNSQLPQKIGISIKLTEFNRSSLKENKFLDAINNESSKWHFRSSQKDYLRISSVPIAYWLSNKAIEIFETSNSIGDLGEVRGGMTSANNARFLRTWHEVDYDTIGFGLDKNTASRSIFKWFPYNKGGTGRKWYGNMDYVINWHKDGEDIKNYKLEQSKLNPKYNTAIAALSCIFKPHLSWSFVSTTSFSLRRYPKGFLFDVAGSAIFLEDELKSRYVLGLMNSVVAKAFLNVLNPTFNFQPKNIASVPFVENEAELVVELVDCQEHISKMEWDSRENSWNFLRNELIHVNGQDLEESYHLFCQYWKNKFFQLHKNQEEINQQFIAKYGLQDELLPDVPFEDITILKDETEIVNGELLFKTDEVFAQLISYAVGCMFGRYSLDKQGLILASQGETIEEYCIKVGKSQTEIAFQPDKENIIPVLEDEWFEDDIVGRFNEFLKVTFGKENFEKNLAFVEECLGKDVRKYFSKDFYPDHIKRYKKRPIYWMFGTPSGSFSVLIYMHRYTPDLLNDILNDYLKEYQEKLRTRIEYLDHLIETGSSSEQTKAAKEKDKLNLVLLELQEYEREVLYPLATERIEIDLDDGVLVNYNKFGNAIKQVSGLNDKKTKEKARKFDWIDTSEIR